MMCSKCYAQLSKLPKLTQYDAFICLNPACRQTFILVKTMGSEPKLVSSSLTPQYKQYLAD